MSGTPTSQRVVEAATGLIKVRGYNAFSYQDIAELVGIRKASIHHHFASKADLARTVVRRFTEDFATALNDIDETPHSGLGRVLAFADLTGGLVARNEMCPCAMMATEAETLPEEVNEAVRAYYALVSGWLAAAVRRGQEDGSVTLTGAPEEIAQLILATIQGAAITARCMDPSDSYEAAVLQLRRVLGGGALRQGLAAAESPRYRP